MSRTLQDGWDDQPDYRPGAKPRRKKQRRPSRNNLMNAIAVAKERRDEALQRELAYNASRYAWWQSLSEEERKRYRHQHWYGLHPDELPAPGTPEAQAYAEQNWLVQHWSKRVAELEAQLAALG